MTTTALARALAAEAARDRARAAERAFEERLGKIILRVFRGCPRDDITTWPGFFAKLRRTRGSGPAWDRLVADLRAIAREEVR